MKAALTIALLVMASFAAHGQDASEAVRLESLLSRPSLLDGEGGPKQALRARGITVDFSLTQVYQGLVSGDGDKSWQYGGKADAYATFDGAKLGLWKGFYVSLHQEWQYGEDANAQGAGVLLPVDTALGLPRLGGHDHDTSLLFTQYFSEQASLTVGKFNMMDVLSKTPILGGGGVDTFMNMGLALPVTGITPPYVLGASLTLKTEPAIFNVFVYDPRNAQDWDVIQSPFSDGTTVLASVTVPVKIAGLSGFQGLKVIVGNQEGYDLRDAPQLLLPPQAQGAIGTKDDRWFASYSFQQYLYQDPANPSQGWGLFGQISVSDGNPNVIEASGLIGIGGTSFLPGRSLDRWGVAYFRYNVSDDLKAGLNALGLNLAGDEQGVEAYYNLALTPWYRVTADIQYIDTVRNDRDDAVFLGLRSQVKF